MYFSSEKLSFASNIHSNFTKFPSHRKSKINNFSRNCLKPMKNSVTDSLKCIFLGKDQFSFASVACVQKVMQANSKSKKIFWTAVLVLGVACTARDVCVVTSQYLEYPVLTSMTLDQAPALSFPAVTVCNLNRVHCRNLLRVMETNRRSTLGKQLQNLHDLTDCQYEFQKRNRRETSNSADSFRNVSTELSSEVSIKVPLPANQTRSFNDFMNFMAIYANFSSEIREEIGHEYREFIRSCTFSGQSCHNFSLYFNKTTTNSYGNCFTFHTTHKTVIPGKEYGLSMEIFLDQVNYLRAGLSPQAGARVIVHERSHEPLPDEAGINISPHTATSIALLQVQIKREQSPYQSNCTQGWRQTAYENYIQGSYTYSAQRCQRVCLQLSFENNCQCSHPAYMDLNRGYLPCNLTSGTEESICANRVVASFESRSQRCDCNADCNEINYETIISTASWPTDTDWCTIGKRLMLVSSCQSYGEDNEEKQCTKEKAQIQGNLLKVEVYLQSLQVRTISQTPALPPQVFVVSLGGALSLYLGLSLLSLLEIGHLFIFSLQVMVKKITEYTYNCQRKKITNNIQPFFSSGKLTSYFQK